ncbi:hypothetical protein HPB50_000324 [Hyalomma asiaticum]|uniref:Uncharacterized protein n=1 Tax=Hyalomma asiaticum TaxID=266040 RepID=A0ACB7RQ65_HYAAI|nr:hypothetical protein HPB50_000324 [Hyalomma asiaticum]
MGEEDEQPNGSLKCSFIFSALSIIDIFSSPNHRHHPLRVSLAIQKRAHDRQGEVLQGARRPNRNGNRGQTVWSICSRDTPGWLGDREASQTFGRKKTRRTESGAATTSGCHLRGVTFRDTTRGATGVANRLRELSALGPVGTTKLLVRATNSRS